MATYPTVPDWEAAQSTGSELVIKTAATEPIVPLVPATTVTTQDAQELVLAGTITTVVPA